jgi:hypothetical protein
LDIDPKHHFLPKTFLCCAAVLAVTSPAVAQTPSAEDIASARTLGVEGVRLADSGDCAAAIPKLEAAERLYHAPTTLERLGECQVNLGQLVAGTESLNRVIRETLPPNAPAPFVAAQHRATQMLATAQPRIGKLRIHVEGAPVDKVSATVDGANVPSALFDSERPTDPGPHEVKATAPGFKTATASVQVAAGAEAQVSLVLEADLSAGAPPQTGGAQPEGQPGGAVGERVTSGSTAPSHVPAFIAFGVGGAALIVGAVSGIMALGTKSSLDNACANKICPPSSQSDIDALSTRATVSTIGFAASAGFVALGAVLFATERGGEARATANAMPASSVRVKPWVGVGSAGVGGTFE